ncbi:hypothetical protein CALCODRAFT_506518 [Calocera cornea HHB12733]|uniref:Uncharacterized protein n=1 Tax=Calocera cornea HHB12733 TaxID=1353952 RepID=A0A165IQJ9_9BASI|nr:hypothetical protein CALCODRAFT_506518 [Calocera cornea HHB12733]
MPAGEREGNEWQISWSERMPEIAERLLDLLYTVKGIPTKAEQEDVRAMDIERGKEEMTALATVLLWYYVGLAGTLPETILWRVERFVRIAQSLYDRNQQSLPTGEEGLDLHYIRIPEEWNEKYSIIKRLRVDFPSKPEDIGPTLGILGVLMDVDENTMETAWVGWESRLRILHGELWEEIFRMIGPPVRLEASKTSDATAFTTLTGSIWSLVDESAQAMMINEWTGRLQAILLQHALYSRDLLWWFGPRFASGILFQEYMPRTVTHYAFGLAPWLWSIAPLNVRERHKPTKWWEANSAYRTFYIQECLRRAQSDVVCYLHRVPISDKLIGVLLVFLDQLMDLICDSPNLSIPIPADFLPGMLFASFRIEALMGCRPEVFAKAVEVLNGLHMFAQLCPAVTDGLPDVLLMPPSLLQPHVQRLDMAYNTRLEEMKREIEAAQKQLESTRSGEDARNPLLGPTATCNPTGGPSIDEPEPAQMDDYTMHDVGDDGLAPPSLALETDGSAMAVEGDGWSAASRPDIDASKSATQVRIEDLGPKQKEGSKKARKGSHSLSVRTIVIDADVKHDCDYLVPLATPTVTPVLDDPRRKLDNFFSTGPFDCSILLRLKTYKTDEILKQYRPEYTNRGYREFKPRRIRLSELTLELLQEVGFLVAECGNGVEAETCQQAHESTISQDIWFMFCWRFRGMDGVAQVYVFLKVAFKIKHDPPLSQSERQVQENAGKKRKLTSSQPEEVALKRQKTTHNSLLLQSELEVQEKLQRRGSWN